MVTSISPERFRISIPYSVRKTLPNGTALQIDRAVDDACQRLGLANSFKTKALARQALSNIKLQRGMKKFLNVDGFMAVNF